MDQKTIDRIRKFTEDEFLQAVGMLDQYSLSVDEHNMALMLLFSFKSSPKYSSIAIIQDMTGINPHYEDSSRENWVNYYKTARRWFSSSLSAERKRVGSNDVTEVAYHAGKSSAAAILLLFKQKEEEAFKREMLGGTPNLGDVRRVDFKKVAVQPGDQFIRFWKDFINEES